MISIKQAEQTDPNFPEFCAGGGGEIYIGDFDADKRSDLVCRIEKGARYQIALTGNISHMRFNV